MALLAAAIAVGVPQPAADGPFTTSDRIERLHQRGVTGENVSVGIVGSTGFDTGHPALADNVDADRSFGDDHAMGVDGSHGTASAASVTAVAPDARLLLATADSPENYRAAVSWLVDDGADVILVPASLLGRGWARTDIGARASRNGTVIVAPTGNLADRHWQGEFDPTADNGSTVHRFGGAGNDSRLSVDGDERELRAVLSWDPSYRGEPPELRLYRIENGEPQRIARSSATPGDDASAQRLVASTPPGKYFLTVHGSAAAEGTPIEVESATHDLSPAVSRGSITAPADGRGVLAVGALDSHNGSVEPYSGRGPTADGGLGVDVLAPARQPVRGVDRPFIGSSAAASYTAGVTALLLDADPSLDPRAVERVLERTAQPAGSPGPDPVTGYGRISAPAAVNATTGTAAER